MHDILTLLKTLNRPRLLVSAAQFFLSNYDRERMLRNIFDTDSLPRSGEVAMRLMDLELSFEQARQAKSATYSCQRHIEVLSALMAEAKVLQSRRSATQVNASGTAAFF